MNKRVVMFLLYEIYICITKKDILKKDGWSTNGQSDVLF